MVDLQTKNACFYKLLIYEKNELPTQSINELFLHLPMQ